MAPPAVHRVVVKCQGPLARKCAGGEFKITPSYDVAACWRQLEAVLAGVPREQLSFYGNDAPAGQGFVFSGVDPDVLMARILARLQGDSTAAAELRELVPDGVLYVQLKAGRPRMPTKEANGTKGGTFVRRDGKMGGARGAEGEWRKRAKGYQDKRWLRCARRLNSRKQNRRTR